MIRTASDRRQVTPQCRRDNGFATIINMNRLRELTAELGFIPATTEAAAIDGRERQLDPQIAERGPGVSTGDRPAQVSAGQRILMTSADTRKPARKWRGWRMRWRSGVVL